MKSGSACSFIFLCFFHYSLPQNVHFTPRLLSPNAQNRTLCFVYRNGVVFDFPRNGNILNGSEKAVQYLFDFDASFDDIGNWMGSLIIDDQLGVKVYTHFDLTEATFPSATK